MNNLAIIPARGGSKRIPRKNIKDFLGKPIMAYSIETALQCGLFNEVMVSTDDKEIAEVAIEYGAKVPFLRRPETSDDYATTVQVLKEVELNYATQLSLKFDAICCIYPTSPLTKAQHLIEGYDLLLKNKADVVFPVAEFSYPIWRGLEIKEGLTGMIWPEYQNSRSQDLPQAYHDAGQWYWYNPLLVTDRLYSANSRSIVLDPVCVQDIDNVSDWKLAEMKFRLR